MPSISYSITVRLELPASGSTISQLTTAVERAGGAVTASGPVLAAAEAISGAVTDEELNANYIIPSVFHADVHTRVATAVRAAAAAAMR